MIVPRHPLAVVPAKAGTHTLCFIGCPVVMGPGSRPLCGLGRDDSCAQVQSQ
jgi:hypothetical protein